jgi:hypothetical protein
MHRIKTKVSANLITKALSYSDRQLSILGKIGSINFMGEVFPITQEQLKMYSTVDGVKLQLDMFVMSTGVLCFVSFDGDMPVMSRVVVGKKDVDE